MNVADIQHLNRDERSEMLGFVLASRKSVDAALDDPSTLADGTLYAELSGLLLRAAVPLGVDALADELWQPVMTLGTLRAHSPADPLRAIDTAGFGATSHLELTNRDNSRRPRFGKAELHALHDVLAAAEETLLANPRQTKWQQAGRSTIANPHVKRLTQTLSDYERPHALQMGLHHQKWFIEAQIMTRSELTDTIRRTFRYLNFLERNAPQELAALYAYSQQEGRSSDTLPEHIKTTFGVRSSINANARAPFLKCLLSHCLQGSPEAGFDLPKSNAEIRARGEEVGDQMNEWVGSLRRDKGRG